MDQLGKADVELGIKTAEKMENAEIKGLQTASESKKSKKAKKAKAEKLPDVSYWELYRYAKLGAGCTSQRVWTWYA